MHASIMRGRRFGQASAGSTLRKTEHALTDNVMLYLVGTSRDRTAPRREHPMGPLAAIDRTLGLVFELAVGTEKFHRELLDPQIQIGRTKLHHRAFRTRRQSA